MYVGVVHPSLNRGGGAERVCLGVIRALVRGGFRVRLYTLDRVDWAFLEERFEGVARPHEEVWLMERMHIKGEHALEFYTSTLFPILLLRSRMEGGCDLLFNTYGDLMEPLADISYINAVPVRLSHRYPGLYPLYRRVASRLYDLPLSGLERLFGRGLVLTNSRFMHILLKGRMGFESLVVHPPVDLDRLRRASDEARDDLVVTVSRLRRGKNLEIVPKVARLVEGAEFIIIGLADEASKGCLEILRGTIREEGVEKRVRLLVNQPFEKFRALLSSAKVYLHTQVMEAFGISVVEAMASGCIPVVPRLGGPWSDILGMREGHYGFSYTSVVEAAERIRGLLKDEGWRREVSIRAQRRAEAFDASIFEEKILKIVNRIFHKISD